VEVEALQLRVGSWGGHVWEQVHSAADQCLHGGEGASVGPGAPAYEFGMADVVEELDPEIFGNHGRGVRACTLLWGSYFAQRCGCNVSFVGSREFTAHLAMTYPQPKDQVGSELWLPRF